MILKFALLAVGLYILVMVMVYALQGRLIFPSSKTVFQTPDDYRWTWERVVLDVGGEQTVAWFVPAEKPRGTLLFSHGNAGNLAHRMELIEFWRALGMNVLAYDYGGYGESTGRPSEQRCYADARAVWDYLTQTRGIAPESIILYGRSLGGGVTVELAQHVAPRAMILESTFLSIPAMARRSYPFLPTDWLTKHRFESDKKLPNIHVPLLHMHSPGDTLVPYAQGRALHELANAPKRFVDLIADHNDGVLQFDPEQEKAIKEFLDEYLPQT